MTRRKKPAPTISTSFEEVFRAECAYVAHSLRRLGVRESDVEDLTQDVFLALHRAFETYDQSKPIRPWLFGFAFRAASNYRRLARHKREVAADNTPSRGLVTATQEQTLTQAERRRMLLSALQTLDLKHRAVLVLVDLDGVEPKHASETLSIPLDTVYSRLRNGRKKLKRVLLGDPVQPPEGSADE